MTEHKLLLRPIGLFLGLGLFGWVVWDAVEKTQSVEWPALPIQHILLATVLVLVAHGLHGLAWAMGARKVAESIRVWDGIGIYSLSFIGRYLPGKVWQIGGLSYLAKGRGADPYQIAGYSLVFLIAYQVIGALIMLTAYVVSEAAFGWAICVASAPVIALALALIYTAASQQILKRLPAKWQVRVRGGMYQPFGALAINFILLALVWLMFGTTGYVLVQGFAPEWTGTWAQVAAATIGGLIAGFLVLIAPSGAGVRESTISIWLTFIGISPVASIALAVALRIIMTAGEFLLAAFGALMVLRSPTTPREN